MAKRKIVVETDNSTWQAPKTRKKRKPMSEKQRQAAAKRLEKARAKRAEQNPDYGQSGIHPTLRDLSDDHPAHPKKVKQWIKTQKELASAERASVRQGIKGAYTKQVNHESYIRNMKRYLKNGVWIDDFWGEYQQNKIQRKCIAMAFNSDGSVKRSVGVWYSDIGLYTQEMFNEDKGIVDDKKERKSRKRKRNSRAVEKKKTKKS